VSVQEAAEELASSTPPLVLDIRTAREHQQKRIQSSVNIPLNQLQKRLAEVPRDRRLLVHCAGGYRSSIAASILQQHGITNLIELAGGIAAWETSKLPLATA
jgi:rhodanese-related sulfurtransferase